MAPYLLLICIVVIFSSLSYFTLNEKHREILLRRFGFRSRLQAQSQTPPRSLSPKKEPVAVAPEVNYANVFPPFRREAYKEMYKQLPSVLRKKTVEELIRDPPNNRLHVPLTTPFDELSGHEYTPTGFTVNEIRQLGDFPDYAALSGVPLPSPCENFDPDRALARPYRPFRWAYHQTMSLTKLESDYWLEIENTYKERIKQRQELYASEGKLVLQHLPGSELACKELMEICVQFLCARYPRHFTFDREQMVLCNKILDTQTSLREVHPLHVLLHNVPEDFAIMLRNPEDGFYTFRAGLLCSAMGWNVDTKIGKRLHEIHEPVPDYAEKMRFSMDRYFAKKPTERAIQRGSWGIEIGQPLFMQAGSAHAALRLSQNPDLNLSDVHLRVDWQTLRRLPLSGAIIFNFKALFTPVTDFRDEPYVPALVLKVLDEGKKEIMAYKDTWHTEHVVKPAFRAWVKEQEENGLVEKDWEPSTLKESPWFPGWEEKWRKAQGY